MVCKICIQARCLNQECLACQASAVKTMAAMAQVQAVVKAVSINNKTTHKDSRLNFVDILKIVVSAH